MRTWKQAQIEEKPPEMQFAYYFGLVRLTFIKRESKSREHTARVLTKRWRRAAGKTLRAVRDSSLLGLGVRLPHPFFVYFLAPSPVWRGYLQTSTGTLQWVKTLCVSDPSNSPATPRLPCEAMNTRSQASSMAVWMMTS